MKWNEWISVIGDFATIATAIIAAFAYFGYRCQQTHKREKLETYLRAEKEARKDQGERTVLHLVRHLGMTEDEIMQASFRSKLVERRIGKDPETDLANTLFFVYSG